MKHLIAGSVLCTAIICLFSCTKVDNGGTDKPKETLVLGMWSINRIQQKIYYSGVFNRDTIVPAKALPKNYVKFDGATDFYYCFNSASTNSGTYQFKGADSVISTTPSKIYRWKMLTLTDVLFTVMSTSTTDPAYPGAKVETYQTFVR